MRLLPPISTLTAPLLPYTTLIRSPLVRYNAPEGRYEEIMAAYQYIYVMKDLGKTFPGGKKVLENIWLSFLPCAKIGVLGPNGAGKSTLLKIMAGRDDGFTGEAWAAEGVKVGFLEQEPQLDSSKTVIGNVMDGVAEAKALLDRFNEVSARFAEPLDDDEMDALMAERSDEHTSELQSLMRISYAVFCLKKKNNHNRYIRQTKR